MDHTPRTSPAWPLVFSYKGTILGQGFLADIKLQGRLLAVPELEGVWLYGVNPGALAVGAPTLAAANAELRNSLTRVFIDFAGSVPTFGEFSRLIEQFLDETDDESTREWEAALQEVRAGHMPALEGLSKMPWHLEVVVTEKRVDTVTPQDNILSQEDAEPALAAAA